MSNPIHNNSSISIVKMPILKRLRIPLYYLKKRNDNEPVTLEKFDKTIYVKSDDLSILEIDTNNKP